MSPDKYARLPTSIEFYDIATGWTFVRDRVKYSVQWQVYEDNTLIAEGEGTDGRRLVSNDDVATSYLRTFLDLLDAGSLKPLSERNLSS